MFTVCLQYDWFVCLQFVYGIICLCLQQPDVDPSSEEQQEAALKIQTKYRQHHAKQVVEEKREEQAAIKIQAGYRGMQDRNKVKEMK